MSANYERAPQTFEEFWDVLDKSLMNGTGKDLRIAWDAGVASQLAQAELDRASLQAEIERLIKKDKLSAIFHASHLDRIVAYEAVVEAARAYVNRIEAEAAQTEPWNAPELDDGIRIALAALSEAPARGASGEEQRA